MTREVLEKKLKIAGVPDYIYNLTGQGKKDECLCLEKIQDRWSVYYLERGIKITNDFFCNLPDCIIQNYGLYYA